MSDAPSLTQKTRQVSQYLLTLIHTQINMTKILTIIGTVIAGGAILAAIAFGAFHSRDFQAEASAALQLSKDSRNKARELSCFYIGELTNKCYKKDSAACGLLQTAETDFQSEFSVSAYESCFAQAPAPGDTLSSGEVVESKTGIPKQVNDSLFFGDEGKLPK